MTEPELDHLIVAGATLAETAAFVEDRLGITTVPGGSHPAMGTHNRLTRIGEATYLEAIAPDPTAARPPTPRWFGLDHPPPVPRLVSWAVRVPDLDDALRRGPPSLGRALAMSRGELSWRIALPPDGAAPESGTLPTLLTWPDGAGPAATIPSGGARLIRLDVGCPDPDRLVAVLRRLGIESLATVRQAPAPVLSASIRRPDGREIELA